MRTSPRSSSSTDEAIARNELRVTDGQGPTTRPLPSRDEAQTAMPVAGTVLVATFANAFAVHPAHLLAAHAVFILATFDINEAQLGLLLGLCFGTAALLSVLAGRISDSVDPIRSLIFVCFSSAASLFLISELHSVVGIACVLVVVGATNAVSQPAGNVLIHRYVPRRYQGAGFGLKMGAIPISGLMSGLLVTIAVVADNWRRSFQVAGLLALLAGLSGIVLYRLRAKRVGPFASAPADLTGVAEQSPTSAPAEEKAPLGWSTWILASAAGLAASTASTIGAFFVLSAVDQGYSPSTSGLLLTAGSVSGLGARFGWGLLADRLGWNALRLSSILLGVGAAALAGLGLGRTLPPLFYVVATMLSFATAWGWPGLFMHGIVQRHADRPGFATSVVQMGIFTGGTVGPPMYGVIATNWGYVRAWSVMGGLMLCATALAVIGCGRDADMAGNVQSTSTTASARPTMIPRRDDRE